MPSVNINRRQGVVLNSLEQLYPKHTNELDIRGVAVQLQTSNTMPSVNQPNQCMRPAMSLRTALQKDGHLRCMRTYLQTSNTMPSVNQQNQRIPAANISMRAADDPSSAVRTGIGSCQERSTNTKSACTVENHPTMPPVNH